MADAPEGRRTLLALLLLGALTALVLTLLRPPSVYATKQTQSARFNHEESRDAIHSKF